MSIKDQFNGLPMDQLIGGPLKAAAEAEEELARAAIDFYQAVGAPPCAVPDPDEDTAPPED